MGGEEMMCIEFVNTYNTEIQFKGLTAKEYDPITGLPSRVNMGGIKNMSSATCHDLKIRLVMADSDMNVHQVFWETTVDQLPYASYVYYQDVPVTDYGPVDFGYSLIAQYFNPKENKWMKIRADKTSGYDNIPLVDEYSIEESTTFRYENSTGTITLTTKKGVDVKCFRDGVDYPVAEKDARTFVIETASMQAGVYTIGLSKASEYHELRVVVGTK